MNRARVLATSSRWIWWAGGLLAIPGLLLQDGTLVTLAAIAVPIGFVVSDVARARAGGITAMTAYSATAALTSFANLMALFAADTPSRWEYFLYVSEPHIFLALTLGLAAAVVPPLVFHIAHRAGGARPARHLLPRIHGNIADRQLVVGGTVVGLLIAVFHYRLPVLSLGSLGDIVLLLPLFVIFVLARLGAERGTRGAMAGALLVAFAEAAREVLVGYMRGSIAAPLVAFVLGALAGAQSLRPLRTRYFLPVYAAIALFVIYFGAFGAVRGTYVGGMQRIESIQAYQERAQDNPALQDQSLLARLSTINQLSQVGRIAQDEGFLHGQTLEYMWYAFIPRFLWPGKPAISKSAWFALEVGLAYVRPDGTISNAVNMTIPGELYLNYGWTGVLAGLALLGLFLLAFWRTTGFWSSSRNVFGAAFAFYLTWPWIGFSLGADLGIVVTIIAVYLLLLAGGWILPALRHLPHRSRARIAHTGSV